MKQNNNSNKDMQGSKETKSNYTTAAMFCSLLLVFCCCCLLLLLLFGGMLFFVCCCDIFILISQNSKLNLTKSACGCNDLFVWKQHKKCLQILVLSRIIIHIKLFDSCSPPPCLLLLLCCFCLVNQPFLFFRVWNIIFTQFSFCSH